MTRAALLLALSGAAPMCGSGSEAPVTPSGFTCGDYQLMVDVELELGRTCDADAECVQPVLETAGGCASASVLLRGDFDAEYLLGLVEEADAYGCPLDLPVEDDCGADAPTCDAGRCGWE